jgi:hypothetical protein
MTISLSEFHEIWCIDFEFSALPGNRPTPVCLVAHEVMSGRTLSYWKDELSRLQRPPYGIDGKALIVAYYASAEMGCHLALNWEIPAYLLDLCAEFRNLTNGVRTLCGKSLLAALASFGLCGGDETEKEEMRELALRGGPWSPAERQALLDYCHSDVMALTKLFKKMLPVLDVPRALLRGWFMVPAANMEYTGIPIEVHLLNLMRLHWEDIKEQLIAEVDAELGVYEGQRFKGVLFEQYLKTRNIAWPRHASGKLRLDDETFREMAHRHEDIHRLRELRMTLSQMRNFALTIGTDGRNRYLLSAFSSKTGRNQPSNTKSIFGLAKWLRGLIKPQRGRGLAYIDYCQQEFGIAAYLSGDPAMIQAYESSDPYLTFGIQSNLLPQDATKDTHGFEREQLKSCVLGVLYGMGAESLALKIGQSKFHAHELLRLHKRTYHAFWKWIDQVLNYALLHRRLYTVFGWTLRLDDHPNPRSIINFPMQANGAEMLRLACCYALERGESICAPIHDAILIEAPLRRLDEAVRTARQAMADASAAVLGGPRLRTDVQLIRYPDRYADKRGHMWTTVMTILHQLRAADTYRD